MGLAKRGNTWWMSFMYRGQQIRRSTGTSDKRLAEAILSKVKVQIIEGRFFEKQEAQERTLAELLDRYASEHAARRANQRRELTSIQNLTGYFGNPTLDHITPKLIVAYKNKRYADGVKPATINRELATLKKAFNLARREWEWCTDNPVSRVSMERENNTRDRWLTVEEEQRLLQAVSPWLRDVIIFALNTGMRMGEILALTWAGVDLFRRTVTVFRSKNGERRTIPVNSVVLEVLTRKHAMRSRITDVVFHSQAETILDGSNIRRGLNAALKAAKIQDFHFHDLRHTFATRIVQAGVDLYKVQRLLGHKSPIMTQRYAHHYPESLREGVEALESGRSVSTKLAHSQVWSGKASVSC
ncbi:MAG: tyrosine-type recombinase/integrase [Nitrospira sp.]|nr:tyrosine-type recombinase/integrase [Nitrospira sp.]MDH4243270.1 tyrosine-type recombinase/integrase [Nitrospira sp.]MDH4357070.1 tyrosine-type recombinase/integrase [Nitrospira sp.]MDH5317385.1 tyrosine-type recombinase/integrase [Nitrospira sp.]